MKYAFTRNGKVSKIFETLEECLESMSAMVKADTKNGLFYIPYEVVIIE